MQSSTAIDYAAVQKLVDDWDAEAPDARDNLITYIEPWFKFFSNTKYVKNKSVINTTLKFLNEDVAQDIALRFCEKFPLPGKGYFVHKKFGDVENLVTTIKLMILDEVKANVQKFTNSKNSEPYRKRLYDMPESEVGDDMKAFELFSSFRDVYSRLQKTHRSKLLIFDLVVFHSLTFEKAALFADISLSTAKNHYYHIELIVLKELDEVK